jgi:hypothetical protein
MPSPFSPRRNSHFKEAVRSQTRCARYRYIIACHCQKWNSDSSAVQPSTWLLYRLGCSCYHHRLTNMFIILLGRLGGSEVLTRMTHNIYGYFLCSSELPTCLELGERRKKCNLNSVTYFSVAFNTETGACGTWLKVLTWRRYHAPRFPHYRKKNWTYYEF